LRTFEQLALALKTRVALEFFTVLKYKFFKPGGGGRPPDPPPYTPMHIGNISISWRQCKLYLNFCKEPLDLSAIASHWKEKIL